MNVHPFGRQCLFTGGHNNPICGKEIKYVWTMTHGADLVVAVLQVHLFRGTMGELPFRVGGTCEEHAAHVREVGAEAAIVNFAIRSFRPDDTEDTVAEWAVTVFEEFMENYDPSGASKVSSQESSVARSDMDSTEPTSTDW